MTLFKPSRKAKLEVLHAVTGTPDETLRLTDSLMNSQLKLKITPFPYDLGS